MSALPSRLPDRYHCLMATLHQVTNLANRGWTYLTLARIAFDADDFANDIHLCVLHLMDALRCARLAEHRQLFDAVRAFRDAIEPFAKDHPYMRDIDLILSESYLAREADPSRIGPLFEVEDALGGFRLDGELASIPLDEQADQERRTAPLAWNGAPRAKLAVSSRRYADSSRSRRHARNS